MSDGLYFPVALQLKIDPLHNKIPARTEPLTATAPCCMPLVLNLPASILSQQQLDTIGNIESAARQKPTQRCQDGRAWRRKGAAAAQTGGCQGRGSGGGDNTHVLAVSAVVSVLPERAEEVEKSALLMKASGESYNVQQPEQEKVNIICRYG